MEQAVRRKYTDEFKREAVDLILLHGYGIAEAARNLDINANMLSRWKQEKGSGLVSRIFVTIRLI